MIKSCRFYGVLKPLTAFSAAPVIPTAEPAPADPVSLEDLDASGRLLRGLIGPESGPGTPRPASPPTSVSPIQPATDMEFFFRLQRRMLLATLMLTALAVPLTAMLVGLSTAFNVLLGAVAGLLYLRLLARSVTRLGGQTRSVDKTQLLVPIVLVLAASRLPQLEILPVFLGFLLYKPAVILQAVLDFPRES